MRASGLVLVAAALLVGCKADSVLVSRENTGSQPVKRQVPFVPTLDFTDARAEAVLQRMADSADEEVAFEGCDESLNRPISIHTAERKSVPVVMAMLTTQLSAAASLQGSQWTLFCREAPGPGRLLRKGQVPVNVRVAMAPEGPK
jgi:hypothetical protein